VFAYFRAPLPWRVLAKRTVLDTFADGCPGLAAQLAFYFLLALFPAVLVIVALLAYAPLDSALFGAIDRLNPVLPREVLQLTRQALDDALAGVHGGVLTLAVAGALWSSSSAMTAIITALNTAYDIEEWRPWWKRRMIALFLTAGLAMFSVVAFALVVGGSGFLQWLAPWTGLAGVMARAGAGPQWIASFILVVIAIDLVYYFAPNAETEFVWITPGALLATALWLATSFGFKLYVQNVATSVVQGAVGSVVVLMLWFYLSGLALLVGAELNAEIDRAMPARDMTTSGPHRAKKIGPAAEKSAREH